MMRLLAAIVLLLAAVLAHAQSSSAHSRPCTNPRLLKLCAEANAGRHLINAIPAIEAYWGDNGGTYVGLTLAAIRKYDPGLHGVRVGRTTRERYCIESRHGRVVMHINGPGVASAVRGACR